MCRRGGGLAQAALDKFRRGIRYQAEQSYACWKCGIQQRLCGRDDVESGQCRWPNVLVPMVRAVTQDDECVEHVLRKLGYAGATGGAQAALAQYAAWLGKRYGRRL